MARDIEEFLRKAAERRNQQQRPAAPPPRPQAPPPKPPMRQQPLRSPLRPLDAMEPEIIDDIEVVEYADSRQSKSNKPFSNQRDSGKKPRNSKLTSQSRHSGELGKKLSQVKDRFDRNVHRHLDHQISKVESNLKQQRKDSNSETDGKRIKISPMAAGLRKMLARPETIGQAILAAEILKRPSFDD